MQLFSHGHPELMDQADIMPQLFHPADDVAMHLPLDIGDYTDFYASEQHAYNVGVMFRDPANALLPNWKHLPVGYHGRASSIMVSGTPVHRPFGQTRPDESAPPSFGPSRQVDFELEIGFVIGKPTEPGTSIPASSANEYIFGLLLFNDLSARDIQKWEYVPLGPFLSKNFGSIISPWIVTMEALEPFRIHGPEQSPEVMEYLRTDRFRHYDLNLEVSLRPGPVTDDRYEKVISRSNSKYLYWDICQMLAHHTVNGCNVRVGDVYATGTISGPEPGMSGSMLELAWKGTRPVELPDGSRRTFLEDHDVVTIRGWGEKDGLRIGFGECTTQILPATR
jgi:fumarylacetoacetase